MRKMQEQNPEEWANIKQEYAKASKIIRDNRLAANRARAVIVRKPEDTINLALGQKTDIEVEVLNDTHWPWRFNCTLGLAKEQTEANLPVMVLNCPIQDNVMGKSKFTVRAPLSVSANANIVADKVYSVNLAFFDPNGNQFGHLININAKCTNDQHLQASNQVAGGAPVWKI